MSLVHVDIKALVEELQFFAVSCDLLEAYKRAGQMEAVQRQGEVIRRSLAWLRDALPAGSRFDAVRRLRGQFELLANHFEIVHYAEGFHNGEIDWDGVNWSKIGVRGITALLAKEINPTARTTGKQAARRPGRKRQASARKVTDRQQEAFDALKAANGNKTQAAEILNIQRATFDERLEGFRTNSGAIGRELIALVQRNYKPTTRQNVDFIADDRTIPTDGRTRRKPI